jgi:hypothetical protein
MIMKKKFLPVLCLSFMVVSVTGLQSCSKYTVTTGYKNPSDIVYKKYIATTYFWGIVNKPASVVDTTCGHGGLSEVKVTSNIGYSLINVVTLGIVHIIKIECKCQKEPPIIGEHP